MEFAISLSDGKEVEAADADHHTSRKRLLVCPECGEPVFFKKRLTPNLTSFFSHYQELPTVKLLHRCSLRAEDAAFRPASQVIRGISKGQLVDRFQREFCRELYLAFGRYSGRFGKFIKESRHELSKLARDQLIRDIERTALYNEILFTSIIDKAEVEEFNYGVADICRFLRSSYGIWINRFIYQAAYFLALLIHPRILNEVIGSRLFHVDGRPSIMVLDAVLIRKSPEKLAEEVLISNDQRNVAIYEIAPILVAVLLLRWRKRNTLLPPLFKVAGDEFRLRSIGKVKSRVTERRTSITPTPTEVSHRPNRSSLGPPVVYGMPQKPWYSPGEVLSRPISQVKIIKGYETLGQQGGAHNHSERDGDKSDRPLVSTVPVVAATKPLSTSTVDFTPDGSYIPLVKIFEIRAIVQRTWPNGLQFGTSKWQFIKRLGLLVNLETRRIYSESQMNWQDKYLHIMKDGVEVMKISRSEVVHALVS